MSDIENKGSSNVFSPLEGEGIRGDGMAHWYVVHTYSGHENKVKVNIEKMVETVELLNKLNEKLKEAKTLINDLAKNEIFLNLVVKNANEKQAD